MTAITLVSSCAQRPKKVQKDSYATLKENYKTLFNEHEQLKTKYASLISRSESNQVPEKKQKEPKQVQSIPIESTMVDPKQVEESIAILREVVAHRQANQVDEAFNKLKKIESSPYGQIQVRVRFQMAELLFQQKAYDLAMQVYEEIIDQYAFSGRVIPSLQKLIVCARELKLSEKLARYRSLLYDVFES